MVVGIRIEGDWIEGGEGSLLGFGRGQRKGGWVVVSLGLRGSRRGARRSCDLSLSTLVNEILIRIIGWWDNNSLIVL